MVGYPLYHDIGYLSMANDAKNILYDYMGVSQKIGVGKTPPNHEF